MHRLGQKRLVHRLVLLPGRLRSGGARRLARVLRRPALTRLDRLCKGVIFKGVVFGALLRRLVEQIVRQRVQRPALGLRLGFRLRLVGYVLKGEGDFFALFLRRFRPAVELSLQILLASAGSARCAGFRKSRRTLCSELFFPQCGQCTVVPPSGLHSRLRMYS